LIIPSVIHPKMDDWVNSKGQILQIEFSASPSYHYLSPRGEGKITITIKIPSQGVNGDVLQSALRIPGLEEHRIPLVVSVKTNAKAAKKIKETDVFISIPIKQTKQKGKQNDTLLQTQSSLKLLASMASLEIIP